MVDVGKVNVNLSSRVISTEVIDTKEKTELFAEVEFKMEGKVIDTLKWHKRIFK